MELFEIELFDWTEKLEIENVLTIKLCNYIETDIYAKMNCLKWNCFCMLN